MRNPFHRRIIRFICCFGGGGIVPVQPDTDIITISGINITTLSGDQFITL